LVGFLLESLIGLIAFWFLEVSSLLFIYMMFNFFLSGHMIPLDWLPSPLSEWTQYLPLKYLAYFPAAILLNRPDGTPRIADDELYWELGVGCLWIIGLLIANRIAFARGTRRYSAYGG
jgi:ABC-2 type transport system permease protein